jgi:hypothetical protein
MSDNEVIINDEELYLIEEYLKVLKFIDIKE